MSALSLEAFVNMEISDALLCPRGEKLGEAPSEFFRDLTQMKLGNSNILSMSSLRIKKRRMVIDILEYHNICGEAILPIDSDIIVQLAPATPGGQIPYEKVRRFTSPKGTVIVLNPGVWHYAPFVSEGEAHIFCMLPERTYENDAHVLRSRITSKLKS